MVWLVQPNFTSSGQTSTFWFNSSSANMHLDASLHGLMDIQMYKIIFDLEPNNKKSSLAIERRHNQLLFSCKKLQ